jgi:hypothetical protein
MKTLAIAMVLFLATGFQSFSAESNKENTTEKKQQPEAILSPELEALFFSGRLGETVVKPVYTEAEQVIFTEQVRQIKAAN